MAVTEIHPITTTLNKALDYIMNPKKTDNKLLVDGYNCSPEIAFYQFNQVKKNAEKTDATLAWHLIQSFAPGEVDYETAHKIGIELADKILVSWRGYTDESAFIYAETEGEPHNTITPIARKRGDRCELDLVLRNNITTKEHPLGVFHPHAELHHIKKENIGLIEVMGLAVLPARLKEELELLEEYILSGKDISSNEKIAKHEDWVKELLKKYPDINAENIHAILQKEVGLVFVHVLEDAGVYKCTPEGRL